MSYRLFSMGDSSHVSSSTKKLEMPRIVSSKKVSRGPLVASSSKIFKRITSLNLGSKGSEYAGHVAIFLLKVAALEVFRRFSRAKCPFAWKSLQALQVICCPPFKWIQRWAPLKGLVMGMQKLSKPLFFLSIGTAFCDQSDHSESSDAQESQPCPEPAAPPSSGDTSISEEAPPNQESESWLLRLHEELEKQGITIPERINENELRRFYVAGNGNFSGLLSSVKKTIHWRKTYYLLSPHELEVWSKLVFWHGYDVKLRPCLIVRLGLACLSLASLDRPRFTQAIVSQIEHAVLHLVNVEDPRITVLMDCEGLTPLKFPMHMLRFCSTILQDNYPNRLACLFVLRLPPVVRVIAQTFFQVLKPATRQKLRIEGEMYKKVLSEHLQTIPSFLGGKCTCPKCSTNGNSDPCTRSVEDINIIEASANFSNGESLSLAGNPYLSDDDLHRTYEQMLRTALISTIMFCVLLAVLVGIIYDPESLRLSSR